MRVLVSFASRHGSTEGIARRIGDVLRTAGLTVDVRPMDRSIDIRQYQGAVLGSAVYYGSWPRDSGGWIRKNAQDLNRIPVWLFSVGPVGHKELPPPKDLAEYESMVRPREHRIFRGVIDRAKLNLAERVMVKGVGAPEGDFRDWPAIDAWASGVAEALSRPALK